MMQTPSNALAATFALIIAATSVAQQRNQAGLASLMVNDQAGSAGPIEVLLPRNSTNTMVVEGNPDAGFGVFFSQSGVRDRGFLVAALGEQFVDLDDRSPILDLFAGYPRELFQLGPNGQWQTEFLVAGTSRLGPALALQGAVVDPAAPWPLPLRLTAASVLEVGFGPVTIVPRMTRTSSVRVNLAPFGMPDFPFYEESYGALNINANGNLTFGSTSGDFVPQPDLLHRSLPRICPFWLDLDFDFGGEVRITLDPQSDRGPETLVEYINAPLFRDSGGRYTFTTRLNHLSGDIEIEHDLFNVGPIYDVIVGIAPGNGVRPTGFTPYAPASNFTDFSPARPKIMPPGESAWEWFGLQSMPLYGQPFDNGFDLLGRTLTFAGLGAGFPDAAYLAWLD